MGIYQEIQHRIAAMQTVNKEDYDLYSRFLMVLSDIIKSNKHHLMQISAQLSDYDIHDGAHSDKVLRNMEILLGDDDFRNLSIFELILLYTSAHLHDCGMALPKWEYELLSSVEGTESIFDRRHILQIRNDLKPSKTLQETIEFIRQNKKCIYADFDAAKAFVFAIKSENEFQADLAKRVIDYENFRNRYSSELRNRLNDETEYLNFSELIRSEYIRSTHHVRAANYINALQERIADSIGYALASRFLRYMSETCRSHGEDVSFVLTLNHNERINGEPVNVQFVSILLRMADAVHFSADRAPLSLYAEKLITNPTSMQHWTAKFQDLNYKIEYRDGMVHIRFSAFCETPQIYYFIQRYINWIDFELDNYHRFIKRLQLMRFADIGNYTLPLCTQVDRSDILANPEKFIPDNNLRFTLEQARILELLMGVQLYKDKYLCLRELYQNSLDACRCMKAENASSGRNKEYFVRFGLAEKHIDGIARKYVYCLDNGTGMTKSIVRNHLLRVGNSYYTSKDFNQQNTNWLTDVKPTSQFGIGILSCYMIADKIEITTRHYTGEDGTFCIDMDGISEQSYYIKPDDIEAEMIGSHGTLVKLFLKPEIVDEINDEIPGKLQYVIHGRKNNFFTKPDQKNIIETLNHGLYYLINSQVGLPKDYIAVEVRLADGNYKQIIPWNILFDYRNYPEINSEDIEKLWAEYHFLNGEENPYKEVLNCREYIIDIPIALSNNDVELYTHISLPLPGLPTRDPRIFVFSKYIWHNEGSVLVDGVHVSDNHSQMLGDIINYNMQECMLNYVGKVRPVLSIDRRSIISISDDLKKQIESLFAQLPDKLSSILIEHFARYKIQLDSNEAQLCIESIMNAFPSLSTKFICALSTTEVGSMPFRGVMKSITDCTIQDMMNEVSLSFERLDMRRLSEIEREIIVGRLIPSAQVRVSENDVIIQSKGFQPISMEDHFFLTESLALSSVIIKADSWTGKYAEYDLVSDLWPIVSPRLFDLCSNEYCVKDIIQGRSKSIGHMSNSLSGIAQLDPVMIHPVHGISSASKDRHRRKAGYVGERGTLQEAYWLFEINNNGELVRNKKQDYVLLTFIAPRELNNYEELRLNDYADDADYIKGVREGWSILFIGHEQKYYIKPGLASREDMYHTIPMSVRENKLDNISYYDTYGELVL